MERRDTPINVERETSANIIIAEADLERGSSSFVRAVRQAMPEKPQELYPRSYTDIVDVPDNGGYGFLAPSFGFDKDADLAAVAAMGKAIQESGKRPLVLSFDEFYLRLGRKQSSIVGKVKVLKQLLATEQEPYSLLVGGMSQSTFFIEEALRDVPSQQMLTDWLKKETEHRPAFTTCSASVSELFFQVTPQSYNEDVTHYLASLSSVDRSLLFSTLILSQDVQSWQDLWWQGCSKKGPMLFMVAPTVFHAAMLRLNQSHGHGPEDYLRRTTYTSSIFTPKDDSDPPELPKGVSSEEFHKRVGTHIVELAKMLQK